MILYHGSNQIIEKPNISFSQKYLDFGKGFYTTTYIEQAKKWAFRKSLRYGKIPKCRNFGGSKMINKDELTLFYRQNLEENIINQISKTKNLDLRKAMDLYYNSTLSKQIETGINGIDNLDYKNLVENFYVTELKK